MPGVAVCASGKVQAGVTNAVHRPRSAGVPCRPLSSRKGKLTLSSAQARNELVPGSKEWVKEWERNDWRTQAGKRAEILFFTAVACNVAMVMYMLMLGRSA